MQYGDRVHIIFSWYKSGLVLHECLFTVSCHIRGGFPYESSFFPPRQDGFPVFCGWCGKDFFRPALRIWVNTGKVVTSKSVSNLSVRPFMYIFDIWV